MSIHTYIHYEQDVDLVWFKDPFPRLHEIVAESPGLTADPTSAVGKLDAIFTDDGQRGIRYTPFFSNSGLYYLVSSQRTEYFAWTVMSLFDLLQRTGSHQNVVALRLMEAYDFSGLVPYLLNPRDFPNGDAFHHDPAYMEELRGGRVHPYSFHM